MEEMAVRQENNPAILENYVQQGRMFLYNAAQNLIQYGRVLVEAKPLVPRGQFESWVKTYLILAQALTLQGNNRSFASDGFNVSCCSC